MYIFVDSSMTPKLIGITNKGTNHNTSTYYYYNHNQNSLPNECVDQRSSFDLGERSNSNILFNTFTKIVHKSTS